MLFFEEKDYTHLSNSRTCRRENEHIPKKVQQKCFSLDFTFSIKLMVKCPWITQHFLIIIFFFKWKSNQLWNVCSCDHTHGRTCSGDSTSSPCSRPLAAPTAPSRSDERVRNTLDRTTSGVDKQWREKKKKKKGLTTRTAKTTLVSLPIF